MLGQLDQRRANLVDQMRGGPGGQVGHGGGDLLDRHLGGVSPCEEADHGRDQPDQDVTHNVLSCRCVRSVLAAYTGRCSGSFDRLRDRLG